MRPWTRTRSIFCITGGVAIAAMSFSALSESPMWDLEVLFAPPAVYPVEDFSAFVMDNGENPELTFTGEEVHALFYEGLPWQGQPTRVFAWYGVPHTDDGQSVPAMVLAHGGGGTAFDEWVRVWNRLGYAAIAMDLTGTQPGGSPGERPRHPWAGPMLSGDHGYLDSPVTDHWAYHAVADVILANSLIRSFPEVDPERVGLTGISWGGFLACIVAGVDPRFRLTVPVYGCGCVGEGPWRSWLEPMGTDRSARWLELWDPVNYLPRATAPTLWVNGSNDTHFPLSIHGKSFSRCAAPKTLSIHMNMCHSHTCGWQPEEIRFFADSILRGTTPLAQVIDTGVDAGRAWVTFQSVEPVVRVDLVYAAELKDWVECEWTIQEARIDADGARASADLPPDSDAWFFNITDARGLVVSTPRTIVNEAN